MLARRYLDGEFSDLAPSALGESVVAGIAPLFGAADHSTLNLESVVGRLTEDEATPGKRWTIQSPPEVTGMLHVLGVDLAVLGNNHISDWEDAGIESTLEVLDDDAIPHVGAGLDLRSAARPIVQRVGELDVATLSPTGGGWRSWADRWCATWGWPATSATSPCPGRRWSS